MSLEEVWRSAAGSPYYSTVPTNSQLLPAILLLLTDRSALNIAVLGVPASLAFGFGSVFMICAVGVFFKIAFPANIDIWNPQGTLIHLNTPPTTTMDTGSAPILSAVSTSAEQLYTLLKCIGFSRQASVQITPQGIRFSVEEGRVVQGLAFLDKALFTSYIFNVRNVYNGVTQPEEDGDFFDTSLYPRFTISLSALLETLQIFGIGDSSQGPNQMTNIGNTQSMNAFSTPALGMNRSCTIGYHRQGSPLCITLTEAGVTTTCELTTYEVDDSSHDSEPGEFDIPLQRDAIIFKIIMRSTWLHNAIMELDSTSPAVLSLSASPNKAPFFALSASGGPFSESTVEFAIDKESTGVDPIYKSFNEDGSSRQPRRGKLAPTVTETFLVEPPSSKSRITQRYRFSLLKKALGAMGASSKVSIRGDKQGVLSLQFMIELGDNASTDAPGLSTQSASRTAMGNVSFIDFRFVPLVDEKDEVEGLDDE
ncbi:DNA repair exonuclease rad1 [Nannizzia gypsea CBS 118893]|uniref:DNA repair exonuclease rad1 n=1 Tax=Arthroderma gypseum (strain ATCC MYA-4604 / CBS 118893) TaxID=535722 RepID=E5R2K8_ARTGP|nr:DNA repair exonuclease rad1 [Nannizzia gypsea CBS 118893]EFQ98666.1 DNA repair exonuclease rad1 [Nannizzia gypsea CBS 118893]